MKKGGGGTEKEIRGRQNTTSLHLKKYPILNNVLLAPRGHPKYFRKIYKPEVPVETSLKRDTRPGLLRTNGPGPRDPISEQLGSVLPFSYCEGLPHVT